MISLLFYIQEPVSDRLFYYPFNPVMGNYFMEEAQYTYIENYIRSVLLLVQSELASDTANTIHDYLTHDEFEMAFEGLFIEVMQLPYLPKIDFSESRKVGELLELDQETVFDVDFWNKFRNYIR